MRAPRIARAPETVKARRGKFLGSGSGSGSGSGQVSKLSSSRGAPSREARASAGPVRGADAETPFYTSYEDFEKAQRAERPAYWLYSDGRGSLRNERYEQALTSFEAYLQESPNDAEGLFYRGVAKLGIGDDVGGLADRERALQLRPELARRPDYGNVFFRRALKCLFEDVSPQVVVACYEQAEKFGGRRLEVDVLADHLLARSKEELKRGSEAAAVESYRAASRLSPSRADSIELARGLVARGEAELLQNELETAVASFDYALSVRPQYSPAGDGARRARALLEEKRIRDRRAESVEKLTVQLARAEINGDTYILQLASFRGLVLDAVELYGLSGEELKVTTAGTTGDAAPANDPLPILTQPLRFKLNEAALQDKLEALRGRFFQAALQAVSSAINDQRPYDAICHAVNAGAMSLPNESEVLLDAEFRSTLAWHASRETGALKEARPSRVLERLLARYPAPKKGAALAASQSLKKREAPPISAGISGSLDRRRLDAPRSKLPTLLSWFSLALAAASAAYGAIVVLQWRNRIPVEVKAQVLRRGDQSGAA